MSRRRSLPVPAGPGVISIRDWRLKELFHGHCGASPPCTSTAAVLSAAAEPLPSLDDPAFGAVFDRFGQSRIVLLGEASHGTSEFYRARAAITRRLIEQYGFTIVAVEADWPDAAAIDRYVRHSPHQPMGSTPFTRFPTWMWRNTDVDAFIGFLRDHNTTRSPAEKVGFYGLDLYNMTASIAAVLAYLDRVDPRPRTRRASTMPAWHPGRGSRQRTGGRRSPKATLYARSR